MQFERIDSMRNNQIEKRANSLKAVAVIEAHLVKGATSGIEAVNTIERVDMIGSEVTGVDRKKEHPGQKRKKVKLKKYAEPDLV